MTLQNLKTKVKLKLTISSGYLVIINYKGKNYSCFSNNTFAYERIRVSNKVSDRAERFYYTLRSAYLTFYDECKAKNGLKISKN